MSMPQFRLLIAMLLLIGGLVSLSAMTLPEWKASKFDSTEMANPLVSGDSADPDADGRVNLMEYALGLEPLLPDADGVGLVPEGGEYFFEYPEVISLSDITYHLDFSTDLQQWGRLTPNPALRDVLTEENGKRYISIWNPNISQSSKKWFTRIFVTLDSGGPNQFLAPTNLTAALDEPLAVNLAWNDNTRLETSTIIERDSGAGFLQVSALASDLIRWKDGAVIGSATYTFRVSAQSTEGPSAFSNQVTVTLPLDSDGDGLSDQAEISRFNTDPFNADSDGDGMPDGWEVGNGLDPRSDLTGNSDFDGDLDTDGLDNGTEFLLGLNPNAKDSDGNGVEDSLEDGDGDGMPNGWEQTNGTDPTENDADLDPDTDGLTNAEELEAGTLPFNAYTDADIVMDGQDGWGLIPELAPERLVRPTYAIIEIGPAESYGQEINNSGTALIWKSDNTWSLWAVSTTTPLGSPPSRTVTNVYGLGEDGSVISTITDMQMYPSESEAWIRHASGTWTNLPLPESLASVRTSMQQANVFDGSSISGFATGADGSVYGMATVDAVTGTGGATVYASFRWTGSVPTRIDDQIGRSYGEARFQGHDFGVQTYKADISPLENYRRNLIEWLINKGFIPEHRENFLSHVTLARHPFDREKWKKTFMPLPVFTQNIHLYESLGGSKYAPLWSFPLLAPFEEIEHIADLAYWIRGTSYEQLFQHAKLALAFFFPPLLSFFSFKSSFSSIESVIELLNKIVHQADTEIGCPFKAVCYHTTLNQGDIMEWEMIIDV